MKLRSLSIEGFRGALRPLTIDFGSAFTIISGRNGTGKSTICDAFEYLLTGTLDRFQPDTEKGERIADYLWWRGSRDPDSRYVKLVLEEDDGKQYAISRGPEGIHNDESVVKRLYDQIIAPEFPIPRLCQTSIIRDETITRFSTDLSETERFEFVNRVIGLSGFGAIEDKVAQVSQRLKTTLSQRGVEYDRARNEVDRITRDLSQARIAASAAEGTDLDRVLEALALLVGEKETSITALVRSARESISELRSEVDRFEGVSAGLREFAPERRLTINREVENISLRVREAEGELSTTERSFSELAATLDAARRESPAKESLAQLAAHGSMVGLKDGRCPLCGSVVTSGEFNKHLQEIRDELDRFDGVLATRAKEHAELKARTDSFRAQVGELRNERKVLQAQRDAIEAQYRTLQVQAREFGLDSPEAFSSAILQRREQIGTIEGHLKVLESSLALDGVRDLERQLAVAREKLAAADAEQGRVAKGEANAREVEATLKRVAAEVVDERLADLSPLLSELYLRLRPHSEWAEIQYLMRGDVRRFLSFRVGGEINPRFVFSSGQRRALGLAFLLGVYLSRKWSRLQTLFLDDPVQHIDDYRALHLVEALAAIRKTGHQIVCAIEDSALADLLCRRLTMNAMGEGVRAEMLFTIGEGISVDQHAVTPLMSRALISA
jgi:chromosome segregation protein